MTDRPPIPTARRKAWLATGVFAATLFTLIALGHDGRRVLQMAVLALPVLVWMAWPVSRPWLLRLRLAIVWGWAMAFAVDGVLRAYLLETYEAAPDSSLVLGAAANTNARESAEYLSMQWRTLLVWSGALAAAGFVFWRCLRRADTGSSAEPRSRGAVLLLAVLVALTSAAYLSKPWRRLHPTVFWVQWSRSVHTLRDGWADQQQERTALLARARASAPTIALAGPSTLVLVITDSTNRDNMGLYGYGRATTPRLQALKARLQDQMLVLRNAWSADASTLPSLHNIMKFGQPDGPGTQHVLALARAAGYKVWWMSNHDDIAIEQEHARLADVVEMVNRVPGRAGASLDGELLDCLREALEDPTERKLIVVHMMGAHPHYSLRFPVGENPFDDQDDAVEDGMEDKGRSAWVRKFRQEYDSAILYSDFVVAETLHLTRSAGRQDGRRAWMFLSDHGQEVGHGGNHAGHSPQTASGYRIPAVVWRDGPADPDSAGIQSRPFRADWSGWTIADLLHLRWPGGETDRNALRGNYRWVAPKLPVAVKSFED
jgi:heptose-I-phosphate ethanolaminephosphotransferase